MNKKFSTIVSTMVIGGMLLSCSTAIFADTTSGINETRKSALHETTPGKAMGRHVQGKMGGVMGIGITKEMTAALVKENVITQETADKVNAYIDSKNNERKAEMEKVKAMSQAERKAYLESKKAAKPGEKRDEYSGMVAAGIITQEQADSIKAYDVKKRQAKQAEQQAKRQDEVKTKLDSLVSEGTITEDQKTKVVEYLNAKEENRKAENEKIKAMTEAERKTYMESKKGAAKSVRGNLLKELVDAGTLTQAQADAVVKALNHKPFAKK